MLRGIYIAAGGLSGREQAIDVIANNLANVDTIGYKADKLSSRSFAKMLLSRIHDETSISDRLSASMPAIGPAQLAGGLTEARFIDFSPGNITFTENKLDLALDGPGFFTLQDTNGQFFFSRDGALTIDAQNYLINQSGLQVLDAADQPIMIFDTGEISIDPDGSILVGDLPAGRLGISEFADLDQLQKVGGSLFTAGAAAGRAPAIETRVIQGAVERSNVNSMNMLTQLLARFREFEAAARSLDMIDRTLDKTVNELSRLNL